MKRIILAIALSLSLGACAQLQTLQNIAQFATATITNPVTKDMEAQIELGFDAALQVLLAYRRTCIEGKADKNCRRNIEVIQPYTRQAKPLIAQLRSFVDNNDQVNATVAYNQLVSLYGNLKRSAAEVGMNVGSLP
jgi:hypothetical protein